MNLIQKARSVWNKEQIRVLVMLSLAMQILLIFLAPLRKWSGNKLLLLLLRLVQLPRGGLRRHGGTWEHPRKHNGECRYYFGCWTKFLTAFQASFLLLHLCAGPDNITSYPTEDNELWWRHFLGFLVQVSVAFMVRVQSHLHSTGLLEPSILVLLVGQHICTTLLHPKP